MLQSQSNPLSRTSTSVRVRVLLGQVYSTTYSTRNLDYVVQHVRILLGENIQVHPPPVGTNIPLQYYYRCLKRLSELISLSLYYEYHSGPLGEAL